MADIKIHWFVASQVTPRSHAEMSYFLTGLVIFFGAKATMEAFGHIL